MLRKSERFEIQSSGSRICGEPAMLSRIQQHLQVASGIHRSMELELQTPGGTSRPPKHDS